MSLWDLFPFIVLHFLQVSGWPGELLSKDHGVPPRASDSWHLSSGDEHLLLLLCRCHTEDSLVQLEAKLWACTLGGKVLLDKASTLFQGPTQGCALEALSPVITPQMSAESGSAGSSSTQLEVAVPRTGPPQGLPGAYTMMG